MKKEKNLPHYQIVRELVEKYSKDKNVVGIYIFGSLAKGTATPKSDVDIEILFKKTGKPYELKKKIIQGIHVDLSQYSESQFIKDFSKNPYLHYAVLNYKILYDPKGILEKYLGDVKKYFNENPKIKKFWQEKEKAWKEYKKQGKKGNVDNYFDVMEQLNRKLK